LRKDYFLDVKFIPNFLIANWGNTKTENPNLTLKQQKVKLDYNFLDLAMAGSLQLKYLLNEPGKSKSRRKK